MAKTLDQYLRESTKANSASVLHKRAVFERAYSLALQLSELREKHSLTQVELAEKTGIGQAEISRIERGVVNPTASTLSRLAEALGAEIRFVEKTETNATSFH